MENMEPLPLDKALPIASRRWEGKRCFKPAVAQGRQAIITVQQMHPACLTIEDVKREHVAKAVAKWKESNVAPGTINWRIHALKAMGIDCTKLRQTNPRRLKWWLRPDLQVKVIEDLKAAGDPASLVLAKYIPWATIVGLRVEESLRLRRQDFAGAMGDNGEPIEFALVMVPGTKTNASAMTLPLGPNQSEAARNCFPNGGDCPEDTRMFPISYYTMQQTWQACRDRLGITDKLATLKAFRRNAARYLHVDCTMPLDVVRQYLRHEDLETTRGYLRTTGGYSEDEMRRFLK